MIGLHYLLPELPFIDFVPRLLRCGRHREINGIRKSRMSSPDLNAGHIQVSALQAQAVSGMPLGKVSRDVRDDFRR
jgi:hypothetical protein